MPLITPATIPVGMVRPGQSAAERAIARIAGPMPTGKSLIKRNGQWSCVQTPSQSVIDECDYYFAGGHTYEISDDLWGEIQGAVTGDCLPTLIDEDDLLVSEQGDQLLSEGGAELESE